MSRMMVGGGENVEMESSGGFQFEEVEISPCFIKDSTVKGLWEKWGLDKHSYMKRYSFDEFFSKHQLNVFVKDFFASDKVQQSMQVASGRSSWCAVGATRSLDIKELNTKVAHLGFFDKIKELNPPVVRDNDAMSIVKCFDEMEDGILISDELRKILLMEDSEHFYEFNDQERKEVIFHILRRLVVGGGTCQYEDDMKAYLDVTKLVYKDLVSVAKNPSTKKVEVTSFAYEICSLDADFELFPNNALHSHSFCYFIIEPLERHVTVWYGAHIPAF